MTERGLHLRAAAKLNLGLTVRGRRDDGFHEIDSLFARLDLRDQLWLAPSHGVEGEVLAAGDTVDLQGLQMDESNLARRAATAYLSAGEVRHGVHIRLLKSIPIAAGLGGGSSDAATVLQGMARLYPAGLDLLPLAESLGSDVPFFLPGVAAARVRGRGEKVSAVPLSRLSVVLAKPALGISAAEAYRLLERPPQPGRAGAGEWLARLASGAEPGWRNDLQAGVVSAFPVVAEALTALQRAGLTSVVMSGSGPTCFGLARDDREAAAAAEQLRTVHPDWWIWSGSAGV